MIGKHVCLTYSTIKGSEDVYGKVFDIQKGNGLIDIGIFPVNTLLGSTKRVIHSPLVTIDRLQYGTFLIREYKDYRQCLKFANMLNS